MPRASHDEAGVVAAEPDEVVLRVTLPPRELVVLAGILLGYDGLAAIREAAGPEHAVHLVTTPACAPELRALLAELAAELDFTVHTDDDAASLG